mgnify:CR=1 FL=1
MKEGCCCTLRVRNEKGLSGLEVRRLMRAHKQTIRGLASAMGITQTRVRIVRDFGVSGDAFVRDWTEALSRQVENSEIKGVG